MVFVLEILVVCSTQSVIIGNSVRKDLFVIFVTFGSLCNTVDDY
jgi:hypothetical protein